VAREIELFRAKRPDGAIHAVIGAGEPPACFPRPLLTTTPDGRTQAPFAADIRPLRAGGHDGPDKGVVRLIAGLLDVPFDALWQRETRRRRARRLLLAAQLAAAAVAAVVLIVLANAYRTHAVVDLDLAGVQAVTESVEVVGTEETPETNGSRVFLRRAASSERMRVRVPASDVILRIQANYKDGAERALALHLVLSPGFGGKGKWLRPRLPTAQEIADHPGMAYIPAGKAPFWIDIRPPTVAGYLPVAHRLMASGQLAAENSFLLTARQQQSAVEQTNLGQLHSLSKDLGEIFGVISQATSTDVSAPGDIVAGLVDLPCETCPAPMTRHEAEVYCRSRGMRLPTAREWELAVRGVDGRTYPWGNRFDPARANVPGLPDKGAPSPALKPVDAYRMYPSPFGLIDTVGNAGDWVVNDVSSYERVYMGATYRFNPEDATAFRMLPVTDSDYLVREITARCVAR
jgi:Sulfatase-modifying factor enzyme 1